MRSRWKYFRESRINQTPMTPEIPYCGSCGQPMFKIGGVGTTLQLVDDTGNVYGQRSGNLYQCPECKDVKIN